MKRLAITGKPGKEIGIYVNIYGKRFTDDIAHIVERDALKAVNFIPGVRAREKDGMFCLELKKNALPDENKIAEAIYWGVRLQYPLIRNISVGIIYDEEVLSGESVKVKDYKEKRLEFVRNMKETNTGEFCYCTECRPFSLEHTCILYPDRVPMCASRKYLDVKAGAYFDSPVIPFKRKKEKNLPLRGVFSKGRILDSKKGEYAGCNGIYRKLTGGKLKRVFLHSVREYPVTSCGCFQNLAFWMEEAQGIGIMSRGSEAVTPDGRTWYMLANSAGGKQTPGIAGVSTSYIHSPNFLKGDGGIRNVKWVDRALFEKIKYLFPKGQKVATEKDAGNIRELKCFLEGA